MNLSTYRIKNWWYYLGYPLLGFAFAGSFEGWYIVLPLTALVLAFSYSMNEKYDRKKKDYDFMVPLLLGLFFLPLLNAYQIVCFFLLFIISISYNHPAIYLKSVPFLVTLLNGIFFSLLFSISYLQLMPPDFVMFGIFGVLFILNIIAQMIHELAHFEEDVRDKISTTAVYLGEKKMWRVLSVSIAICMLYSSYIYLAGALSQTEALILVSFLMISSLIIRDKNWKKARKFYRYLGILSGSLLFTLKVTF